jgi:hypothetical protein
MASDLLKALELEEYREKSMDRSIFIDKICIYKSAGMLVLANDWQNYRPLFYARPFGPSPVGHSTNYGSKTCDKKPKFHQEKSVFGG